MALTQVKKRNGLVVPFDRAKIEAAMAKAFAATQTEAGAEVLRKIADGIIAELEAKFADGIPGIEDIQDVAERSLAESGYFHVAKAYIIYRRERTLIREKKRLEALMSAACEAERKRTPLVK